MLWKRLQCPEEAGLEDWRDVQEGCSVFAALGKPKKPHQSSTFQNRLSKWRKGFWVPLVCQPPAVVVYCRWIVLFLRPRGIFPPRPRGIPLIFECIISWIFDSVNWIFVKVNISILRAVSSNLGGAVLFWCLGYCRHRKQILIGSKTWF